MKSKSSRDEIVNIYIHIVSRKTKEEAASEPNRWSEFELPLPSLFRLCGRDIVLYIT